MISRERRPWTPEEDDLLRAAVRKEEPGNPNPSKWFAIATHVPGRTNKDCRKRWFARMAADIVRGVWSAEEDAKLMNAVAKYGTKWSKVARMVHSRNSDQCAKRWTDTLDPSIDRTGWSQEQDQMLLDAVNELGTCWKKIVRTYFPGKTGLSAKNRYTSLTRLQNAARGLQNARAQSADDDDRQSSCSHTSNESYVSHRNAESWPRSLYTLSISPSSHAGSYADNQGWGSSSRSAYNEYNTHASHPRYLESVPLPSASELGPPHSMGLHSSSCIRREVPHSEYDYHSYQSYSSSYHSTPSAMIYSRRDDSYYGYVHHPVHHPFRMQDNGYRYNAW